MRMRRCHAIELAKKVQRVENQKKREAKLPQRRKKTNIHQFLKNMFIKRHQS
jgi:hypothetical protein